MMWQATLAVYLLAVGQVSAGLIGDAVQFARREEDMLEQAVRRYIDGIERRAAAPTATSLPTLNITAWNSQTMAACTTALQALNGVASNPSGQAVCYNLPFLDNQTGVFQADLRLFSVSAPSGAFANIPSDNVTVGLSYADAQVSPLDPTTMTRRDEPTSLISWPRRSLDEISKRATITMTQAYSFVGQINKNELTGSLSEADLQKILTPTVSLTGIGATGDVISTTLSSSEANFVNGVFAKQVSTTSANVQKPLQTLVVAANEPFVVPGLKIIIFPIGGIITGVWAVLFIGTIVYGTIGRSQFREQYRTRVARANKGYMNTI